MCSAHLLWTLFPALVFRLQFKIATRHLSEEVLKHWTHVQYFSTSAFRPRLPRRSDRIRQSAISCMPSIILHCKASKWPASHHACLPPQASSLCQVGIDHKMWFRAMDCHYSQSCIPTIYPGTWTKSAPLTTFMMLSMDLRSPTAI